MSEHADTVRKALPYTGGGHPVPYKDVLRDALAALDALVVELREHRERWNLKELAERRADRAVSELEEARRLIEGMVPCHKCQCLFTPDFEMDHSEGLPSFVFTCPSCERADRYRIALADALLALDALNESPVLATARATARAALSVSGQERA